MKRSSCNRCARPISACLCAALPSRAIDNSWSVHILQHRQEQGHALNTARIAMLGLGRCQLHTVTDTPVEDTLAPMLLAELDKALLIYPGIGSRDIGQIDPHEVINCPLVLLDASWRKSRRMLLSSAWLQTLPRISFELLAPSRYRIRREPEARYCSSLEALCAVLGSLEQTQEKYAPLLATMDLMIRQQIGVMGEEKFRNNYLSRQQDSSCNNEGRGNHKI